MPVGANGAQRAPARVEPAPEACYRPRMQRNCEQRHAENPTDDELMAAFQAGDPAPLAELSQRHRPDLVAWASRMLPDRHAAEDVAQETFLAVLRSPHGYTPRGQFRAWLRTVALYRVRERRRKDERVRHPLPRPETDAPPDLLHDLAEREAASVVWAAVEDLDPLIRDILRLRHGEDLTQCEIAGALRVTRATVAHRIRGACALMRRHLAVSLGEGLE